MEIKVTDVGKKYGRHWLFSSVNHTFKSGSKTAVLAPNGFGKSTLLKIIAGFVTPNKGNVTYRDEGLEVTKEQWFRDISFTGPYVELPEELTLNETVQFHAKLKPFHDNIRTPDFSSFIGLEKHQNKVLKDFSSGMKQRVKLGLCMASNSKVLLLDEPTSNLDKAGIAWYQATLKEFSTNKIVVISSNDIKDEYFLCTDILNLESFKP